MYNISKKCPHDGLHRITLQPPNSSAMAPPPLPSFYFEVLVGVNWRPLLRIAYPPLLSPSLPSLLLVSSLLFFPPFSPRGVPFSLCCVLSLWGCLLGPTRGAKAAPKRRGEARQSEARSTTLNGNHHTTLGGQTIHSRGREMGGRERQSVNRYRSSDESTRGGAIAMVIVEAP